MTSVTGGFWPASTDASHTKNECSAARPRGAAVSDLGRLRRTDAVPRR